jgi:hypothetical protein
VAAKVRARLSVTQKFGMEKFKLKKVNCVGLGKVLQRIKNFSQSKSLL